MPKYKTFLHRNEGKAGIATWVRIHANEADGRHILTLPLYVMLKIKINSFSTILKKFYKGH